MNSTLNSRWVSADAAVARIKDGATLALAASGGGLQEPDALLEALARRYRDTGHPRDLTLVHALGIGDGKGSGLGHLAAPGMVRRIIGGHWSWAPALQELAYRQQIEAYALPAGVITTLLRECGAGRPGVITRIGLDTFADPIHGGGKCGRPGAEDIVERIELDGEVFLRYRPLHIDVALVRGSVADARGNLSCRDEPADLDVYAAALAAHNNRGMVLAQVRERQSTPIVPARDVTLPGVMIDALVVHREQRQSYLGVYDPALSGQAARDPDVTRVREQPEGLRRIIAARAARELRPGMTVNYGFGIPGGISSLVDPEVLGSCWEMVEQGIHNGELLDGALFGAARYPQAIMSSSDQFDFFSGGGLDIAFLGMGEMDRHGNVNVSWLGDHVVGPGGFVDITQGARCVVFCGAFEARGLKVSQQGGQLRIESPGAVAKLVDQVRHITFSGEQARKRGQQVLYITERAVFRLTDEGIALVEVAQGVDMHTEVLARMAFTPQHDAVRVVPLAVSAQQDSRPLLSTPQ